MVFVPVIIAAMVAAILSPSVFANSFAKSSDGDSGGGDDKPKTSNHRKGDDGGGGMPVPGVPAVRADNKEKNNNKDSNNGGGRLIVPGSPVVTTDIGNGNDNDGTGNTAYNNGNIKEFDTSKSPFRIGGSDGKVVQYVPGFNETFYNSTLPYCFAVQSGSCYNTATGQIMP